ncbi:30S ribosomal protein S18 [Candidatus Woesebacteria bacterium RIFCSPHIGHO2_02_FULL_42_20]|uniref:Small ribosomal subunit protein bS18 n=1 Tax=Candidatus Woesebacteria bacterium RIFCSPHIGHO2_12_FULL_41_24 TaxID=1802510 RepID=A0A1F8AR96_9BACT|nr:MAG: 30S ribosomal protein S18 [Candidatus Woesebacteria bacterium RBG_16_41_13]OGM29829.1 MAG: 30S ribosomal protein S18 [Candidatus Woesebacteria bacterium RIFCSPHIGHO2_01_FULL_42_80]OGM35968.1 MAG: 30S ribosomal protein S18 [Candidatus Woesebacteria bacterium RIFCSPHIGHO2_02_FULL_42_20]OGM54140.1 MAG: 30S ribosomal protein S18 [Candidatus Woesebacteria bacterium RIFCSPHIGHO2_12_FULL_41_24]OGM66476.1 MAG: 30S ribosomal protein S18 [Candidatus Woesebacteria bacterium RIFCSPLOWO2_01_FULL_42_
MTTKSKSNCYFCDKKTVPSYKSVDVIEKFVSDRARIVGRYKTGVCAKHQRLLSLSIKRARHLGLLPFSVKV